MPQVSCRLRAHGPTGVSRVRREGRLVGQGREEPQRDRRGALRMISSLKKSKTDKKTAS